MLFSHVRLFMTTWTTTQQVSMSSTISRSLLRFMTVESMMPSNHLILCLLLSSCPQAFPTSGMFNILSVKEIQ